MAYVLAIDTSSSFCSVAIKAQESCYSELCANENSHSEQLSALVAKVCESAKIKVSDINQIVCGSGPGSFTGLRIGFAFAKGLALSLRIPLGTFPSLLAAANSITPSAKKLLVVADARRDEMFCAEVVIGVGGQAEFLLPSSIVSSDFVYNEASRPDTQLVFAGANFLPAEQGLNFPLPCLEACDLATGLLRGLTDELRQQQFSLSQISALTPDYLRAVAARSIAERQKAPI